MNGTILVLAVIGNWRIIKNKFQEYYKLAGDKHILHRALRTSLIVGSILNIIHNPQVILAFTFEGVHLSRVLLTFLVPYLVSTISAIQTRIHIDEKKP